MIKFSDFSELSSYLSIPSDAIAFVKNATRNTENKRYDFGADCYVNIMNCDTKHDTPLMEAHEAYIDIQYLIDGEEKMLTSDKAELEIKTPYSEKNDCAFYCFPDKFDSAFYKSGEGIALFPNEAHLPNRAVGEAMNIKKAVIKLKVLHTVKYCFKNAEKLNSTISILAPECGIAITSEENADIVVNVTEVSEDTLNISLDRNKASITYGGGAARFNRALATLNAWQRAGETKKCITENPLFTANGAMVDMSRNAVMNVETVKFMMRKMALMGLNSYMLYTEDTYEVKERPYFGYMRGRYTKEELRELDRYAMDLGIELIPCVQFLGHLATYLRWYATKPYKDTANVLLVGEEETYKLIDDMLKTISECFTSRRLHMGMDETHDLGVGHYLDKNGYRERSEIFLEHLHRVSDMAKKYGFKPMMWSDMFFRLAGKNLANLEDYDSRVTFSDDIKSKIPEGVQQVFWDYYHPDEDFYTRNIEKHKMICDNTMFAGGVWTWSGHCPHFSRSRRNSIPALEACKKGGIREVIATVWHNGAEANTILSLAGLAWYADYDYTGRFDEKSATRCFENATGLCYDDFMALELPELPHGGEVCISRPLTYNDPLIGLIDKHIQGIDTKKYYKAATERLSAIGKSGTVFDPSIEIIKLLSSLLENKADYGVRLKSAYDKKDTEALKELMSECDIIIEKLKLLRTAQKKAWFLYYKPFGWEVHDVRYGAMIMRFETAKERISDFTEGRISSIEELEAERLRLNCTPDDAEPFSQNFLWFPFQTIFTTSKI